MGKASNQKKHHVNQSLGISVPALLLIGIAKTFKQATKPKGLIACITQTTSPVGRLDTYWPNFLRSPHCRSAHVISTIYLPPAGTINAKARVTSTLP